MPTPPPPHPFRFLPLLFSFMVVLFAACAAHSADLFETNAHSLRIEQQDEMEIDPDTYMEQEDAEFVRLVAMWENDGIFKGLNRTDRYYTSGLKIDAAWSLGTRGSARRGFGVSIGHSMFTPKEIETPRLRNQDRPYAGWLYGAAYWQWESHAGDGVMSLDHLEFDLGVVGPSAGADIVQRRVHTAFDQERPRGWRHQLKDEIAADVTFRKKWRIGLTEEYENGLGIEVIPMLEGTLGTVYRRVGAGVTIRGGLNLPDDYGPMRIEDVGSAVSRSPLRGDGHSVYGFATLSGRLTEHNIFLDGNQFRDSHSVSKRPYTAEARVGVEWTHRSGFHAGYSWTFQTDEYWGQDGSHSYATIVLGWTKTF